MDDTEARIMTVRIPVDLISFAKSYAAETYNTPSGIVRLALAKLRESQSQEKQETEQPALSSR